MTDGLSDEPTPDKPNRHAVTRQWTVDAFMAIKHLLESKGLNPSLQIITRDSWMGSADFIDMATMLKSAPQAAFMKGANTTLALDLHNYQMYTTHDDAIDQAMHIQAACAWGVPLKRTRDAGLPVHVGEWTALTKICVRSDGSTMAGTSCKPSDGPGCQCTSADSATWNSRVVAQVRRYVEAQLDVFAANADGDFVWTFGGAGGWGVDNLTRVGAFPSPVTARSYIKQCSSRHGQGRLPEPSFPDPKTLPGQDKPLGSL